jgi:hypothetical protein
LHPSTKELRSSILTIPINGENNLVFDEAPPADRNRNIVNRVWGVLAVPYCDDEDWSGIGEWAAVRYAREIGCPVYLIRRDGTIYRDGTTTTKRLRAA